MNSINESLLIQSLQHLLQRREELLAGNLAPQGAWIHEYEVQRRYPSGNLESYRYAKWQANQPIFVRHPKQSRCGDPNEHPGFTKHQHIGRVSSTTGLDMDEEVREAYRAWKNRQRLDIQIHPMRSIIRRHRAPDSEMKICQHDKKRWT